MLIKYLFRTFYVSSPSLYAIFIYYCVFYLIALHGMACRALALSVAMMVYGKEEGADSLIEQLSKDRGDLIFTYSARLSILS